MINRVVLGYAGGFDAAPAIAWLKAHVAGEVVAVTMDLGQGQALEELRDRALAAGAARAHVLDLRDAFAASYVLPSLKAGALGPGGAPLAAPLARALVADTLVEMADIEQAGAVAHGALAPDGNGAGLDTALAAVNPAFAIVAIPAAGRLAPRVGVNLWGRTLPLPAAGEGSTLPENAYTITSALPDTPSEPASVEIRFERGVPASVNGVPMPLVELISTLAHLAGIHGVGRVPGARAVVEAPAAVVLHAAQKALQDRTGAPPERGRLARQYADMIAGGGWGTAARTALDTTVDTWQERANGSIRLRLFRGNCELTL